MIKTIGFCGSQVCCIVLLISTTNGCGGAGGSGGACDPTRGCPDAGGAGGSESGAGGSLSGGTSGASGGAGAGGSGDTGGTGGGVSTCAVVSFAQVAQDFPLPEIGPIDPGAVAFDTVAGTSNLGVGVQHKWATLDLDGDGRPDLVRTSNSADLSLGNQKWVIYKNTGAGFAPGTDFTLPNIGPIDSAAVAFNTVAGTSNLGVGAQHKWATLDLDGDGRPDLVRTSNSAELSLGNQKWVVYKNTGAGFAPGIDFALPSIGPIDSGAVAFDTVAGTSNLGVGVQHKWATLDLDGDGRPDLVRTSNSAELSLGNQKWLVYKNTGAGFAPGTDFTLPNIGPIDSAAVAFNTVAGTSNLGVGVQHKWTTLDLDDDGRPDLVSTSNTAELSLGNQKWVVYKNTGAGFAPGIDFALPSIGPIDSGAVAFDTVAGTSNLGVGVQHKWATLDLDGDGRPDLVRTSNSAELSLGNQKWVVYKNTDAGFAPGTDFTLPNIGPIDSAAVAFNTVAGTSNLGVGAQHKWATLDLDGDGRLDLVRTALSTDSSFGNQKWLLYSGDCAP